MQPVFTKPAMRTTVRLGTCGSSQDGAASPRPGPHPSQGLKEQLHPGRQPTAAGDLDRWADSGCLEPWNLREDGAAFPGRPAASHRPQNYHLAGTKQLQEKPAQLAGQPSPPDTGETLTRGA